MRRTRRLLGSTASTRIQTFGGYESLPERMDVARPLLSLRTALILAGAVFLVVGTDLLGLGPHTCSISTSVKFIVNTFNVTRLPLPPGVRPSRL